MLDDLDDLEDLFPPFVVIVLAWALIHVASDEGLHTATVQDSVPAHVAEEHKDTLPKPGETRQASVVWPL